MIRHHGGDTHTRGALREAQPGRDAFYHEGLAGTIALERSDRGGMIRLYHEVSERDRPHVGRFKLSHLIPVEEARSRFGYDPPDSSD